jgi:septation ring formation regulator EzrA
MDKLKKFELMEKISRELEDIRNSQQAVLEKIAKVEVDNIELGDKTIESKIPEIYSRTADNSEAILEILNSFQEKTGLRRGSRSSTGRVEHQYARKSTGKLYTPTTSVSL